MIFLGNLEVCTKLTEETYGRDAWEPGDVWALNDSYLAGTHLNDVTVFSPIFHEGELIGFGASRAHWLDVGAKDPGSPMDSTDIWQEGIRMGPIKVADGGRVRPDNSERPPNGGAFRPLEVKVRAGSLLAAEEPAPCAWYFTTLGLLIDLVVKALAPVIPELAAGASYGDSMVFGAAGIDPRNGALYFHLEPTVGGWGAWQGSDGEGSLINNVNGAMKDFPVEILETKVPLRVRRYAIRPDSGGAGQWRGGNGVVREFELLCDETTVYLWWERSKTPAWGLYGGREGAPPEVVINPGREDERHRFKSAGITLRRGDVVRGSTGGGGGYGDPAKRDRAAIGEDIANSDLSLEAARELYGYKGAAE